MAAPPPARTCSDGTGPTAAGLTVTEGSLRAPFPADVGEWTWGDRPFWTWGDVVPHGPLLRCAWKGRDSPPPGRARLRPRRTITGRHFDAYRTVSALRIPPCAGLDSLRQAADRRLASASGVASSTVRPSSAASAAQIDGIRATSGASICSASASPPPAPNSSCPCRRATTCSRRTRRCALRPRAITAAARRPAAGGLRRRDDERLGAGQKLADRDRDVAGAGRPVHRRPCRARRGRAARRGRHRYLDRPAFAPRRGARRHDAATRRAAGRRAGRGDGAEDRNAPRRSLLNMSWFVGTGRDCPAPAAARRCAADRRAG